MTVIARGRFYEDGPLTFCVNFDRHGIGCTCAVPQIDVAGSWTSAAVVPS